MTTTATYIVSGMTCGHCVTAVTQEIAALDGVTTVEIDLVPGGDSRVTVSGSATPPAQDVFTEWNAARGDCGALPGRPERHGYLQCRGAD